MLIHRDGLVCQASADGVESHLGPTRMSGPDRLQRYDEAARA